MPCKSYSILQKALMDCKHWTICSIFSYSFVKDGSTFVQSLAMGSVQFCGFVADAKLPRLSPQIKSPLPPVTKDDDAEESDSIEATLSLAAGMLSFMFFM